MHVGGDGLFFFSSEYGHSRVSVVVISHTKIDLIFLVGLRSMRHMNKRKRLGKAATCPPYPHHAPAAYRS
jgi:hypothetical protein